MNGIHRAPNGPRSAREITRTTLGALGMLLVASCAGTSGNEVTGHSTDNLANCSSQGASSATSQVDVLPYMLAPQAQSIGGFEQVASADPDGAGWSTFLGYQFGTSQSFLVHHYDSTNIYLRYEVNKQFGWIREFDEVSQKGTAAGAIWSPRYVTPGGPGVLSTYAVDKSVLQGSTWSNAPAESVASTPNFLTTHWATLDMGGCQNTVLRIRQEWQPAGYVFEDYDYAYGQGFVHWQWNERLDYLMSRPAGAPNQYVGFWDNGTSRVIELDTSVTPPTATAIDGGTRTPLDVTLWTSHYTGAPQWYVTTKGTAVGASLSPQPRFAVDPATDFQIGAGQTLSSLPRLYTAPAGGSGAPASGSGTGGAQPPSCDAVCQYISNNLYQGLLGHAPDANGLKYWAQSARSGGNGCAQLAVYFIDTAEFQTREASIGTSDYVTLMYSALLGRAPDPAGLTNATNALNGGSMTRSDLAKSILQSTEFDGLCKNAYGFSGSGAFSGLVAF